MIAIPRTVEKESVVCLRIGDTSNICYRHWTSKGSCQFNYGRMCICTAIE